MAFHANGMLRRPGLLINYSVEVWKGRRRPWELALMILVDELQGSTMFMITLLRMHFPLISNPASHPKPSSHIVCSFLREWPQALINANTSDHRRIIDSSSDKLWLCLAKTRE